MGKRFILSEDEKLNIRDLYKGLINEQQSADTPLRDGDFQKPKDDIPRKYLPIADKFCDILNGKGQLKRGAKGDLVKGFQESLNRCGIEPLERLVEDGDFGSKTKEAVESFQRKNNLKVDGGIGKETSRKMCELECLPKELCTSCLGGNKEGGVMVGEPIMGDVPVEGRVGVDCQQVHKCISEFMEGLTEDFCVDEDKVRGLIKCVGLGKCFEDGLKKQIPGTGSKTEIQPFPRVIQNLK
jgi:peptidoglycan hydrolase-like protein with peptidoglycan-binding domain